MKCQKCAKEVVAGDRVREDFHQKILVKRAADETANWRTVVATYWGIFRGLDHDPLAIFHARCARP